jgi:hypothetical protein
MMLYYNISNNKYRLKKKYSQVSNVSYTLHYRFLSTVIERKGHQRIKIEKQIFKISMHPKL